MKTTELCGSSSALSFCSLDCVSTLSSVSIRCLEVIPAICVSIPIVVVELLCCFCCVKVDVGLDDYCQKQH